MGFADRILLSKSDLVGASELESLRGRLVQINPRAPVKPVHFGETPKWESCGMCDVCGAEPDWLAAKDVEEEPARRKRASGPRAS